MKLRPEQFENSDQLPNFQVGYHVVCVLDLLGQRSALAGWDTMPEESGPSPEMLYAIKQTAGTVLAFRDMFHNYFRELQKPTVSTSFLNSVPSHQKELYLRARQTRLSSQQFSDTFVFYAPLSTTHGDVTLLPVLGIFIACAWSMIVGLGTQIPFRAGVCIGTGIELSPQNFYGPGLATAHHLESCVAKHPRIVVSKKLCDLLRRPSKFSDDPTINLIMANTAKACAAFLTDDVDGHVILDYLGEEFRKYAEHFPVDFGSFVNAAVAFADLQQQRFHNSKDFKVANYYHRLLEYLQPRQADWQT